MGIKKIRQEARKVNFSSFEMKKPMLDRKEKEIIEKENFVKRKFFELKNVEETIGKIQLEIENKTKGIEGKERILIEKEQQIIKMADLWKNLNSINLNSLSEGEVKKIVNSQKGFIRDLLNHYVASAEKEKDYLNKINVLESKNKELNDEVDSIMEELEKLQEN